MGRRISAALIAVGAVLAGPTLAQVDSGTLTEAQKRRIHLPYVRASTDCVARGILSNPEAVRLARFGQWDAAANAMPKGYCANEVAALIRTHDQLYGAGTGQTFFSGPYILDLPRALGNRLRPEFDRLAAVEAQAEAARLQEVARQEADRNVRIERADRAFDLLKGKMYDCTNGQVANLINSAETAEVLATAAMTVCRAEVTSAVEALDAKMRAENGASMSAPFRTNVEDGVRKNVVTFAVQMRAALNTPRAPAPSPPSPPPVIAASAPPPASLPDGFVLDGKPAASTAIKTCLRTIAKAREGQFVDRDGLVRAMLDLCRPEIETSARTLFLKDDKTPLEKLREAALADALVEARAIVGRIN